MKEINKRRKKENKALYRASPVACGWAGAVMSKNKRYVIKAGYTAIQSRTVVQEQ